MKNVPFFDFAVRGKEEAESNNKKWFTGATKNGWVPTTSQILASLFSSVKRQLGPNQTEGDTRLNLQAEQETI